MLLTRVQYLFFLMLVYGFYGWIILIPVHSTAGGNKTGTAQIGVGNVPQGSPALAADIVGVFFNSIAALIVFYLLYREYVAMRIRYRARHFKVCAVQTALCASLTVRHRRRTIP